MRVAAVILTTALLITSSSVSAKRDRGVAPLATPAGKAKDCVITSQIRSTRVYGDKLIDFHMIGGKVYRNELPYACSRLGFEERFMYKTSTGQLCSIDTITVLESPPIMRGASCGLGKFQPVTLEKK